MHHDQYRLRPVPSTSVRSRDTSRYALWMIVLVLILLPLGCGGGSVGTGTGEGLTTVEGRIVSPEGIPLEGVSVTLPGATGTATTDASGFFVIAIPTNELPPAVAIQVSPTGGAETTLPVGDVVSDPSAVVVQVVIDEAIPPVVVQTANLTVQAVGLCAPYFLNNRTIQEIEPVPPGLTCTFNLEVTIDGIPRADVRYRTEYRACDDAAPWIPLSDGITTSESLGSIGTVDIPYIVDTEHCVYRIVAPIGDVAVDSTGFEIVTLLKQSVDGAVVPPAEPTPEPTEEPTPEPTPMIEPTPEMGADVAMPPQSPAPAKSIGRRR